MWWVLGVVLAYALLVAVIVALARPRTAGWERDRQAAPRARRTRLHTVQRRRVHRHP